MTAITITQLTRFIKDNFESQKLTSLRFEEEEKKQQQTTTIDDNRKQEQQQQRIGRTCAKCGSEKTHMIKTVRMSKKTGMRKTTEIPSWYQTEHGDGSFYCSTCYSNKIYYINKFLVRPWKIPNLSDFLKMIPKINKPKKKKKVSRKSFTKSNFCRERACLEQQEKVDAEYGSLTYTEKFAHLKLCKNCKTFWPLTLFYCPCCAKRKKGGKLKNRVPSYIREKRQRRQERLRKEEEYWRQQREEAKAHALH